MQLNALQTTDTNGIFTFGSLRAFLQNHPNRFDAGLPNKLTERGLRQTLIGLYAQDDWKLRPNLTLNLGLRYEMTTVPTEVQGKLATLINITDPQPHLGDPYFLNPTLRNFEPRIGFSWDPFRDGKTAVRGGFGLFDVLPLPYESVLTVYEATPFFVLGSVQHLPPGSFPSGAFQLLGPSSVEATFIEHKPHRNYVMQRNLNIQREIGSNLVAMIGYVGSRGVHQPSRFDDVDIVIPKLTPAGYLWPNPVASGTKINPNFGSIRALSWTGDSYFNALETQITKRMSHGLQIQGSFTWGKSIDTSSSTEAGNQYSNSISSEFWPNLALSRGLSDFNIGRTLVISGSWQIPSAKSLSGPAAWIANGWELGAIYRASDGVPFSATFGTNGDPLGLNSNDPWDFPNRLGGPGCRSLVNPGNFTNYIKTECFAVPTAPSLAFYQANCDPSFGTFPQCFNLRGNAGRNIMIGPGTSALDFSVFKNNAIRKISESFNIQFRAEFFNILNRPNFAVPVMPDNTDIFDSSGGPTGAAGLLTSTTTTSREIQFALKVVW
jgi:outer membrane receptor protein involved in Fe transport